MNIRQSIVVLLFAAVSLCAPPAMAEGGRWQPHIDIGGRLIGSSYGAQAGLFAPIAQNGSSLWYASIGGGLGSGAQISLGTGFRHQFDDVWTLGAYGHYGRSTSGYGTTLQQGTFGLEALSDDFDARINAYLPFGTVASNVDVLNTAQITGSSVIFRGGMEYALSGVDAELGWRLPVLTPDSNISVRAYLGGYHYRSPTDFAPDIAGIRGRLELSVDDLAEISGSRLTIGGNVQSDNHVGTQYGVFANLRLPIGGAKAHDGGYASTRSMTAPIVRNGAVATLSGTYGPTETVVSLADGTAFTVLNGSNVADTAALNTALANAGATTVIMNSAFTTTDTVLMAAGQTLIGSGTVNVLSPSGRTAALTFSGGSIATAPAGPVYALNMSDDSQLRGMSVTNDFADGTGRFVVSARNRSGVIIEGNVLKAYSQSGGGVGVDAMDATNGIIRNNTIIAGTQAAGAVGIRANSASNLLISGNKMTFSTSGPIAPVSGNGVTSFASGSTGNTTNAGTCNFTGAPTGSVGFSTISCP